MKRFYNIFLFFLLIVLTGFVLKNENINTVVNTFKSINVLPDTISYTNSVRVNNRGGHLQGVQLIKKNGTDYVFLTGSSDLYAYYAVVKLGDQNKVISVSKLMDKPFKHAGGFQVCENLMAIGIEDNAEKNKSKVCIYEIINPEIPVEEPVAVIERAGEPYRSTAGCVGITKFNDNLLVVVGDWDTKHLDFYTCDYTALKKNSFEKIFTLEMDNVDHKNWVDKNWYSYQNINLITSDKGEIYLIGFGQNEKQQDVADLFSLQVIHAEKFKIIKLVSKVFESKNNANFRAGAGITMDKDGNMEIISCGSHIQKFSVLNIYRD